MQVKQHVRQRVGSVGMMALRLIMLLVVSSVLDVLPALRGEAQAAMESASEPAVVQASATSTSQYDEGLADFMDYIGAKQAAQLLRNPNWADAPLNFDSAMDMASYTELGTAGDATSIDNLQKTPQWVRECNNKRAQEAAEKGISLPALKISPYLMAVSALQSNWTAAASSRGHAQKFGVGENLSWGYTNPFDGWYTEEKKEFDSGVTDFGRIGHYKNIVNTAYTVTGFAVCQGLRNYGWGDIRQEQHEQSFDSSPISGETLYTADEFEQKINEWLALQPGTPMQPGIPMYRLYNQWSYEHFYTASLDERNNLIQIGWNDEQIGWYAPSDPTEHPVYRLYNPYTTDHHYTMSESEYNTCQAAGWSGENVGWYSDPKQAVPLYREYNPWMLMAGSHNYTSSRQEHDYLCSIGWIDENIGWYGV